MKDMHRPLDITEVFGLRPFKKRFEEVLFMLKGDEYTPPSRFGPSSLGIFYYKLAVDTWLGKKRSDGRIPIYNLFNHTQTPLEDGWSVRRTQVRDFRGKTNTYDSHNGTDFAIPTGTVVVSPAPGVVLRVCNEFHRGGLKVIVDHGHGVITTSNHLGRALVEPGDKVARAEPIALSGGSGVDMVAAFPWNCPHVHFNVWLNGEYVDPFGYAGYSSLWVNDNDPTPHQPGEEPPAIDEDFQPTTFDSDKVEHAIDCCIDAELAANLRDVSDPAQKAVDTIFHMNYFPTRFSERPSVYAEEHQRQPLLDLPFRAEDFVGIVHLD